ncbi:MAG: hypothetical protein Q9162_006938 [Coniocarpon cinnabarinum]
MAKFLFTSLLALLPHATTALKWQADEAPWNLNQNPNADHPTAYWGEWQDHSFHPSPQNWRFPFYALTQDRFVDGDPTNNEANGTHFEHEWTTNSLRFGGDLKGIQDSLDYLQGYGIKGIYMTGSPFLNMPWAGHGYGPLDFTLLDHHHGMIQDWRDTIDAIHRRDMYVVLDNTMSTMGNLLGFDGYWQNASSLTPFNWGEYDYAWKYSDRQYHDFHPSNEVNESCVYPRMWDIDGMPLDEQFLEQERIHKCRASEFDSYGAIEGVGQFPVYENELSKFASVQDRLREWQPNVLDKINVMSCMQIAMLDIDGFRMDKGVQITVDAQASFADYQRQCARKYGKDNFLVVGEIVANPQQAPVFIGRGKQADSWFKEADESILATNNDSYSPYLREFGMSALDGSAFEYTIYGALTRFLGLSGWNGMGGVDFVDLWGQISRSEDQVNPSTGKYDPRNMFGTSSQDVFRWPALERGAERQALGFLITMLQMPGIPIILYGDEQASYILENTDSDYLYGRMPMSSARAWQMHGCYTLGADAYYEAPFTTAANGCNDITVSLDHRDPSHPMRNLLARMFELRRQYPTLNDGFNVTRMSKSTREIYYPGSFGYPSETGLWSVFRGRVPQLQDFTGQGAGNQGVWLLYHNENHTVSYNFDCSTPDNQKSDTAPFPAGTTVKNLFYPYEEYTLEATPFSLSVDGVPGPSGCISNFTMDAWGFKAFVPINAYVQPAPKVSRVLPMHDARIESTVKLGQQETVFIEIRFSQPMDCDSVARSLNVTSTTSDGSSAKLDVSSVSCQVKSQDPSPYVGGVASEWTFAANLVNVGNGIHAYTVTNPSTTDGSRSTNSTDRFIFRVGHSNNPIVFPWKANYTQGIYNKDANGDLVLSPTAAGADMFRYSTNFGSSYSNWMPYTGQNLTIEPQEWSGTDLQAWEGNHLLMTFWSRLAGSADHLQHTDLEDMTPRRWPHAFVQGEFNQFGFDGGLNGQMELNSDNGLWEYDLSYEYPTHFLLNVWGINPDGLADKTLAYGDVDGDGVLDIVEPDALAPNVANLTDRPPRPHLGYRIQASDANMTYSLQPVGSDRVQLAIGLLLALIPILTGGLTILFYIQGFYKVKFNQVGISEKRGLMGWLGRFNPRKQKALHDAVHGMFEKREPSEAPLNEMQQSQAPAPNIPEAATALEAAQGAPNRRHVLIATMEYIIEDWNISVKIGGLGQMAALMGNNLGHQDMTWVVPCVGGVDYPTDEPADSMSVTVMGEQYEVKVQYHKLRNITFVLLDTPVFRKQTKKEPYPPRMDDLDSGIYYSAWNQCIAQAIDRFQPDIYHINDYHGTLAPLYLLPRTLPCIYSLHNAEFQGLWPLRTASEKTELCDVFNLPRNVLEKYVQFGEVFNLLHAGASYLRIHQKGYGAIGVSNKYGKRAFARYPCLWGLHGVGGLPNPDPSDTAVLQSKDTPPPEPFVDQEWEASRGEMRKQAQEWAGLNIDPEAELFVFVGRWSFQKGIDLIADVMPSVLEENPKAQLLCVGPTIDLYGKFAALKLEKMVAKYPGRVFSKPEFIKLEPFIFKGAEFALIPSRDEPFGLVAVEFGRKGALGVGARVGGLGQMPGWWYTIESIAAPHLLRQFKTAIRSALASKTESRAIMRARSNLQRFPVLQWVKDYESLQNLGISSFKKQAARPASIFRKSGSSTPAGALSGFNTPGALTPGISSPMWHTPVPSMPPTAPSSMPASRAQSRAPSPERHGSDEGAHPQKMGSSFGPSNPAGGLPRTSFRGLIGHSTFFGHSNISSRRSSPAVSRKQSHASLSAEEREDIPPVPRVSTLSRVGTTIPEANESGDVRKSSADGESSNQTERTSTFGSTSQEENPGSYEPSYGAVANQSLNERIRNGLPPDLPSPPTTSGARPSAPRRRSAPHLRLTTMIPPPLPAAASPGSSTPGTPSGLRTPGAAELSQDPSGQSRTPRQLQARPFPQRNSSILDLSAIRPDGDEEKNYNLQRVDPFFTDPTGYYYRQFSDRLDSLTARNSVKSLCTEDFIKYSEKDWFNRLHSAKLGKSSEPAKGPRISVKRLSSTKSVFSNFTDSSRDGSSDVDSPAPRQTNLREVETATAQFEIDSDYKAPRYLRSWLQLKIGDWQLYTFILAFGQIIALQSYQVTLLTGQVGETANKLYCIASVYLVGSLVWYLLFRTVKAVWCLSLPFIVYGIAFFLIGMSPYVSDYSGRGWLNNVATGFYAFASASGSMFFALNFGTEGGSPTQAWVYRACVVSGTQSLYVAGLWYWGAELARVVGSGAPASSNVPAGPTLTAICTPIAIFLWVLGAVLFAGLPKYYRQRPGSIPSFYKTVATRKIILWFFVTVILQNYWLSAPYGRNWRFLWTTAYAPAWAIALLVVAFFVIVWGIAMALFHQWSKVHSWILPLFAIGLGAPRWCQMLWGISGLGMYVPWGGPTAGALLSRSLWLWLGVLDSLQGVGFGMILLQTLSRYYVVFALIAAQVIGSVATIVARATAPDKVGPGDVFPNFALDPVKAVGKGDFWGCLICQVAVCVGFAVYFRKEQLFKP